MTRPRVPRSRPRPKLRGIPRQQTEAAVYAEMQQLTVEKQRLQQELESIEERRLQIHTRLDEIATAVQELQTKADDYAAATHPTLSTSKPHPKPQSDPNSTDPYHTFSPLMIEY